MNVFEGREQFKFEINFQLLDMAFRSMSMCPCVYVYVSICVFVPLYVATTKILTSAKKTLEHFFL